MESEEILGPQFTGSWSPCAPQSLESDFLSLFVEST
jgi:hypothetical protein